MQQKLLLCSLILACSFALISPFGGSLNLATLTESVQVTTLSSSTGAILGASVASCDFNNDGKKDFIIGAPGDNSGAGVVTVLFGGRTLSGVDMANPMADGSGFLMTYSGAFYFGGKVVCIGDVNNDQIEDIAIANNYGTEYLIVYGSGSYNADVDIASLSYPAVSSIARAGSTAFLVDVVGIGDTTGDDTDDFVIVLQDAFVYSALVFYGSIGATEIGDSPTPGVSFRLHNGPGQGAQISISSAGKFDGGDSLYDFAVGNLNGGTQVAVIFGNSAGYSDMDLSGGTFSLATPQRVMWINDGGATSGFGNSVAYAGDINSDGFGDLLIGSPNAYSSFGAAFLIYGSNTFSADISANDIQFGSGQGHIITHGTVSGLQGGFTVFGCQPTDTLTLCPAVAICDYSSTCIMIFTAGIASMPDTFDMDTMKSEDGFPVYNSLLMWTYPMQIAMAGNANGDAYPDYLIGQGNFGSSDGRAYIVFGLNKCTSPCKTCAGLLPADWTKCTSCESATDFLYNYACISSCPTHTYQSSSNTCSDCDVRCEECSTTANNCDSCDSGGSYPLFYDNYCYDPCPSGTYQDSATTCADCGGNCVDCSGTDTTCTSCDTSGSLPWLYNNDCITSCPSHTFEDSATTCADCDGNCLECNGTDTYCTSCDTGGSLPLLYNNGCYGTCPLGSFQDSGTTCASCNSKCLDCNTGANICSSCNNAGLYPWFYNSFCYGTCPSRTYEDSATTCADCNGNCLECSGTATNCISCDTSGPLPWFYNSDCFSSCPPAAPYMYSFVCYIQCPAGTAADSQKVCIIVLPVNILPEESRAVKALSTIDDIRQISNEIMSLISSLLFGGIHPIRSQSVQGPLSYFVFVNVDYPENYGQFGSSNFGSSNLPNPFKDTGEIKTNDDGVKNANKYLDNQSLLANVGYSILLLLLLLLLIPINDAVVVMIEKHKKDYESKRYYKLLKRGSILFRWSFLMSQFISKYQDIAFFSFLGIYNAGVGEKDTLNLVICIFGFLITVAGLAGAFFKIKRVAKKLEGFSEKEKEREEYTQNDFLGRRLVLYKELQKDKLMPLLYPFFLMLRVFGFCFVTIFLCNQTAIQLVFLNLYAIFMFAYLAKYRPLEERGQLWLTFAFEIDAFIALFGVTILAIYNSAGGTNENTRTGFGYLIIASNTGMMILNFISFFMEIQEYLVLGFKSLRHIIKKSKNKNKIAPEQIPSRDTSFMPPPTGKEFIEGTPSVMPEGIFNFNIESPELVSPNNMSEVNLPPISSCLESGTINERLSLLRIENSMDQRRSSARKRSAQDRQSINLPVTEIPESEISKVE